MEQSTMMVDNDNALDGSIHMSVKKILDAYQFSNAHLVAEGMVKKDKERSRALGAEILFQCRASDCMEEEEKRFETQNK